ncbi:hypothetical protein Tco_0958545 [Tanacetum coccineum]
MHAPFRIQKGLRGLNGSVILEFDEMESGLSIKFHNGLSKPLRSGLPKPLRSGLPKPLRSGLPKPLPGDKMAEENVPAPTRTDAQLVPVKARLPIGKINLLIDLQKMQENPIFRILVDLLALGITPKDSAHPFVAPPAGDLAIKTFFSDAANLKVPTKKRKPHVIPYCQFTKLIIFHLGGRHNIHKRPQSPLHIMTNDYLLANLKFVPKGELDEVFAMAIPKDLITDVIHEEDGKKKKAPPVGKSKNLAPAKQPKPVKKKPSKPTPSRKIHKGKRSDHLVDEADEEPQSVSEPQVEDDEYNLQRGIQMCLESFQAPVGRVAIRKPNSGIIRKLLEVEGKGKGIIFDEQDAQSLLDLQKRKKKNAETGADTEKSTSKVDTEIFNDDEEYGEEVSHTMALEEITVEL